MPTQNVAPIFVPPLINGMGGRAPIMLAKTSSYTVTAADSGTVFHTTGAGGAVVFTLPAINTGPWHFLFINGADQDMTITSATADTIVTYNDLNADSVAFSTSSEKIGGAVEVWCDGTTLFVLGRPATIYQTITIATA